jgi:hypothetical protein
MLSSIIPSACKTVQARKLRKAILGMLRRKILKELYVPIQPKKNHNCQETEGAWIYD